MLIGLMTFIVTTAVYALLFLLACRRVAKHLQGNTEGTKAVVENVLLPVLGRRVEKPEVKRIKD
jgi:hypothetical protein